MAYMNQILLSVTADGTAAHTVVTNPGFVIANLFVNRFRRHVVVSSDSGNGHGDSDSQLQASEETAVMVSVEVTWSNLSSSDESAVV